VSQTRQSIHISESDALIVNKLGVVHVFVFYGCLCKGLHYRLLITICSDTSEWKFVTSTTTSAPATPLYVYGLIMFDVMDQKDTSPTALTVLGVVTTADTAKMSPCPVIVRF